jgi:8-oxo-dGTP pyrophosphatase MutT (NUDIX family)
MDGIKREVQEELGLDANLLHFVQDTGVDVSYDFATVNKFTNQKGQTIRYFIFCWPDPDLSKLKFDNTAEIEFDKVDWMSWDQLLENVAQVKHAMYAELRKVAEPMINEYLNKDHVDVDVRTVAVPQEQE